MPYLPGRGTHPYLPANPSCGLDTDLGQIPPPSLPPCMTWANDVCCLDLSLPPSELGGRMLTGPSWQEALGRRCHL